MVTGTISSGLKRLGREPDSLSSYSAEVKNEQCYTSTPKSQRLEWLGHVERMPKEIEVTRIYKLKSFASRPTGRPKNGWEDDVRKDCRQQRSRIGKRVY
jgi:hypothetical protein